MTSLYESNESVPRARIPHYPARTPQPHLGLPPEEQAEHPSPESRGARDVSYDELIITASVEVSREGRESEESAAS